MYMNRLDIGYQKSHICNNFPLFTPSYGQSAQNLPNRFYQPYFFAAASMALPALARSPGTITG